MVENQQPSQFLEVPPVDPEPNHRKLFVIIGIAVIVIALSVGGYFLYNQNYPPPSVIIEVMPCDIDRDDDCDERDIQLISNAIGQCNDGDNYNALADADHDGCVTETDKQILFPDAPTITPSEVEGWKTYRNEKFGFEFQYPARWDATNVLSVWITKYDEAPEILGANDHAATLTKSDLDRQNKSITAKESIFSNHLFSEFIELGGLPARFITIFYIQSGLFYQKAIFFLDKNKVDLSVMLPIEGLSSVDRKQDPDRAKRTIQNIGDRNVSEDVLEVMDDFKKSLSTFKFIEPIVTISTDKDNYNQGEVINITVENGLDKRILYSAGGDRFWGIEYFKDDKWVNPNFEESGGFQLAEENLGDDCYIKLRERMPPFQLKSQSNLSHQWNQRICPFGTGSPGKPRTVKYIEGKKYRFIFNYGFEISDDNPFRISDSKTIYSNTFTIE